MRTATAIVFATDGAANGVWIAHLSVVRAHFGLSPGSLAGVLVVVSGGAIVGTFVGTRLMRRFGDARVVRAAIVAAALLSGCTLAAPTLSWLIVALLGFAVALGVAEVAMNAVGARIGIAAKRAWMSAFHGCWSLGFFCTASLTAILLARHGPDVAMPCALIVIAAVVGAASTRGVQRDARASVTTTTRGTSTAVYALAAIVFFGWLGEGALTDWAPVYMSLVVGQSAAIAATVSTLYALAMTSARFAGDALAERFGARTLLVVSTGTAALAIAVAASVPTLVVTTIAFTISGAAIANLAPLVFGLGGRYGQGAIGTLTSIGYAAFLGGPVILGAAAHVFGLRDAFILPVCALALSAMLASRYREGDASATAA